MRVAIVTSIHPDFDSRIWKYAQLARDLGHEVHMVCPWQVDQEIVEGIHFHTFRRVVSRRQRFYKVPFRLLRTLLPLLPSVDLVHFHDIDILPYMTLVSFFKPVIYDVHELYPEGILVKYWIPDGIRKALSLFVKYLQIICSLKIRNVILVVESQTDDFLLPRLHWTYIRNYATVAILQQVSFPKEQCENIVIFTGTQQVDNGSDLLLTVASIVSRNVPSVKFICFDRFVDRTYRKEFLEQRQRQNLEEIVRIQPVCKPHELVQYLDRAKVAISPNLRVDWQIRGIPTKIFEYMAAGLPMVLSDLPYQVDVLERGKCGLTAQPEDPESFARAIQQLINDEALAEEMGRNGQKAFLEHYSWESQGQKLDAFYRHAINSVQAGTEA